MLCLVHLTILRSFPPPTHRPFPSRLHCFPRYFACQAAGATTVNVRSPATATAPSRLRTALAAADGASPAVAPLHAPDRTSSCSSSGGGGGGGGNRASTTTVVSTQSNGAFSLYSPTGTGSSSSSSSSSSGSGSGGGGGGGGGGDSGGRANGDTREASEAADAADGAAVQQQSQQQQLHEEEEEEGANRSLDFSGPVRHMVADIAHNQHSSDFRLVCAQHVCACVCACVCVCASSSVNSICLFPSPIPPPTSRPRIAVPPRRLTRRRTSRPQSHPPARPAGPVETTAQR